ncbi:intraflagellar transport protein 25 homolog [Bombina bombina]|uniref:intraflagellar transport protein 25 homolog n=1 Tax=Bombina bombina TaxID=8345 RepID=UPI00235B0EAB|nr:intraflagellar transport protein 25 homolog [Bombina bombina]
MTRSRDPCASSSGARVTLATSGDSRHPADCIVDGDPETFWVTTGMFPQEFIISLSSPQRINSITLQSFLVQSLRIEKSISKEPVDFECFVEKDLEPAEGHLQNEEFPLNGMQVAHLRFVILSGYDHFVAVRSVSAEAGV